MLEINCPFCKETIISDVVNIKEQVIGQWQCNNGHTFALEYIETITNSNEGD